MKKRKILLHFLLARYPAGTRKPTFLQNHTLIPFFFKEKFRIIRRLQCIPSTFIYARKKFYWLYEGTLCCICVKCSAAPVSISFGMKYLYIRSLFIEFLNYVFLLSVRRSKASVIVDFSTNFWPNIGRQPLTAFATFFQRFQSPTFDSQIECRAKDSQNRSIVWYSLPCQIFQVSKALQFALVSKASWNFDSTQYNIVVFHSLIINCVICFVFFDNFLYRKLILKLSICDLIISLILTVLNFYQDKHCINFHVS